MRYWHPFTESAIADMKADGIEQIVVLPLYPHFSISTSGSSFRELKKLRDSDSEFKTEVMGASFRNVDEIKELAGCDLLTIAPKFLDELNREEGQLIKKLDENNQFSTSIDYKFDERDFRLSMLEDQMASEKP